MEEVVVQVVRAIEEEAIEGLLVVLEFSLVLAEAVLVEYCIEEEFAKAYQAE